MTDEFDPYHRWLGIPPHDQPPTHYRLLGIERFEANADVIDSAAMRCSAHVRSFQAGQNSAASQRLLSEIALARACLLNQEKKAAYDQELRQDELPELAPLDPAFTASSSDPFSPPRPPKQPDNPFAASMKDPQVQPPAYQHGMNRSNSNVLTLGIVSLVVACIGLGFGCCCPPVAIIGLILGGITSYMAYKELQQMDAGEIDAAERHDTKLGFIFGLISVGLSCLPLLLAFVQIVLSIFGEML